MAFRIDNTNALQHIADKPFSTTCPHCNAFSGLSLVSAPRYEYMQRFESEWVGFVFRCDACNQPVFLKSRVSSLGAVVLLDEMIEIERSAESFELQHLPPDVADDFKEALTCYSNSCWNAFAAMTRRTLQSTATHLGTESSTKVQQQLEDLRQMGVVEDEEGFKQLKAIMLAGHDGAHPHLPKLSAERAARVMAYFLMFLRQDRASFTPIKTASQQPPLSASNSRRTSSSEMSAGQPYAAATAASRASCASASHCGRAL